MSQASKYCQQKPSVLVSGRVHLSLPISDIEGVEILSQSQLHLAERRDDVLPRNRCRYLEVRVRMICSVCQQRLIDTIQIVFLDPIPHSSGLGVVNNS